MQLPPENPPANRGYGCLEIQGIEHLAAAFLTGTPGSIVQKEFPVGPVETIDAQILHDENGTHLIGQVTVRDIAQAGQEGRRINELRIRNALENPAATYPEQSVSQLEALRHYRLPPDTYGNVLYTFLQYFDRLITSEMQLDTTPLHEKIPVSAPYNHPLPETAPVQPTPIETIMESYPYMVETVHLDAAEGPVTYTARMYNFEGMTQYIKVELAAALYEAGYVYQGGNIYLKKE